MEIDNETADPVDYEQTGGSGEAEPKAEQASPPPCPVTGQIPAGHSTVFPPCGRPNYTVVLSKPGKDCTVTGISNPAARLIVKNLDSCDITVDETPG